MPSLARDPAHPPIDPQLSLAATSDESLMHQQIATSPLSGPGNIVKRLGQQFMLPRYNENDNAEPSTTMSNRPGINTGES